MKRWYDRGPRRSISENSSKRNTDHYPVEHWLFGRSRIPADETAASDSLTSVRRSEPALHAPVPAGTAGLLLFRFEGAARLCRVGPGDVPPARCCRACVAAQAGRGPSRAQLLETVGFLLAACRACECAGVDRSPRACPGRAAVLVWFPLAYSGSRAEMSVLERVPISPLRIPKRARASLFSKLQRANGECLGV